MGKGRVIGIDFGTKRVGLAIADPLKIFAQPYGTFDPDTALAKLQDINASEGVGTVVVGWPLLPDGSEGDSTRRVSEFMSRISKRLPDARIIRWDERFTSYEARELISRGEKPSMKTSGRGRIDAAAAGIILQEFLDA